jgi:DNA mismatch repair protein MutS2
LYQLIIGTSGESNALWISKKMNIRDTVLQRAKGYIDNKDYHLERVNNSKVRKPQIENRGTTVKYEFQKGDRVKLLNHDDVGIVYEEMDNFYNVVVFYESEFIKVNVKRLALELPATELYPKGYDVETLFVDYKDRKLQHDIERGSKKALRKIQKEMKKDKSS